MIEIKGVYKSYGSVAVLEGIDLQVKSGEVVCLIGPSGSGKSTLLRCINGLESYDQGDVLVNDERVERNTRTIHDIRSRVAMVFQRFNLFPHRTALENVMEGPIYVKKENPQAARRNAEALMEKVGLSHRMNAYPDELSGGQQQRVAIARALAMNPQAILFDEPTSALDPELVGEVLAVMRNLADEGMTMIVVTHEMAFARDVADKVCFLHSGKIVESGPAGEVLSTPAHPRTQDFLRRLLNHSGEVQA
ncbi:amino acid ABC transporter ATP-binding protein [Pseudomonas sp. SWRI196]|uniref:Amino acid ABC transporter ATP-binding protein n=1 Tax=Pseudomonas tehranensis TaxID=2745502 RepID=A0ABR6UN05_9PSED|nr:amino acid ABC transporter ATP-binding protein [Pseudomonas tehranensis]MBC3346013.1 amino acid ABC transporter ATP-binding protein [Pseudomonas tehranensis]